MEFFLAGHLPGLSPPGKVCLDFCKDGTVCQVHAFSCIASLTTIASLKTEQKESVSSTAEKTEAQKIQYPSQIYIACKRYSKILLSGSSPKFPPRDMRYVCIDQKFVMWELSLTFPEIQLELTALYRKQDWPSDEFMGPRRKWKCKMLGSKVM